MKTTQRRTKRILPCNATNGHCCDHHEPQWILNNDIVPGMNGQRHASITQDWTQMSSRCPGCTNYFPSKPFKHLQQSTPAFLSCAKRQRGLKPTVAFCRPSAHLSPSRPISECTPSSSPSYSSPPAPSKQPSPSSPPTTPGAAPLATHGTSTSIAPNRPRPTSKASISTNAVQGASLETSVLNATKKIPT